MSDDPLFCILHSAVIDNNLPLVRELASDPLLRQVRNCDDLTAHELAYYLGRQECSKIFAPHRERSILVALPEKKHLEMMTREQFQDHFGVTYREHLCFSSYSWLQKVQRLCPITLKYTPLGSENRSLAEQYSFELELGRLPPLSIRWIDSDLRYGVFAERTIPKGAFVGEFAGEVRILSRRHPNGNEYCFHYPTRFFSWHYCVIDALEQGNETRFINHSDAPNLQLECLCSHSLLHVVFFSKEEIPKGAQLSYQYGRHFWRHRPAPRPLERI